MSSSFQQITCPTCNRRFVANPTDPFMPFCSDRCKLADLNRWMTESIGLPTGSSEPEDDKEPAPPPAKAREWKFD